MYIKRPTCKMLQQNLVKTVKRYGKYTTLFLLKINSINFTENEHLQEKELFNFTANELYQNKIIKSMKSSIKSKYINFFIF